MVLFKVFGIFAVFLVLSCVSSNLLSRYYDRNRQIWNGFQSKPGQFPHQASVGYLLNISDENVEYSCGGALLDNEWVVTVAHCAHAFKAFKVILGAQNINKTTELGRVIDRTTKIFYPPKWNASNAKVAWQNDLALVKLSKKIKFTDRIQPVLLPKTTEDLYIGREVLASGWGANNKKSPELQWVTLRVISNSECKKIYEGDTIYENMICAKSNKKQSICEGDSGGPLILKNGSRTLIGVSLFGGSCYKGVAQGFTRITSFLQWIKNTTGIK